VQVPSRGPVRLRRRRAADDGFIAQLGDEAFAEYDPRAAQTTLRLAHAGTTWVASRDNQLLGFAVVQVHRDHAELCAIAVAPGARGSGVGTQLVREVVRALELAGVARLTLHTAQANLSGLDLFLKLGFRVNARIPRFYRGMFEACAMSKTLNAAPR